MKHLKLFEGKAAPRRYSDLEIKSFKKITEYCEEYVQDILDECSRKNIVVTSYTRPDRKGYEWCLIIKSYYPIQIENLIRKMSVEFEVGNWYIQSSGTSSMTSQMPNATQLTLSLVPKFELD